MFGFRPQSYEELLEHFNEETIYNHYLGHCKLDEHFNSVLHAEKTPSMILTYRNGAIRWYDFGKISHKVAGSRAVHLVMELAEGRLNYWEAIEKIYQDLTEGNTQVIKIPLVEKESVSKQIIYKPLKFKEEFIIRFFKQFCISRDTLDLFNVHQCTELSFNGKLWHKTNETDFMILYLFNSIEHVWQLYRPYAEIHTGTIDKKKKFRPNNMEDVIMGYAQLPPHSPIIAVTKAYKEVMLGHEMKLPSVCKVGERTLLEPYQLESLRQRCDHLIYIGDNDPTGRTVQAAYKELGLTPFEIKGEDKDPTDLAKTKGYEAVAQFYYFIKSNYYE